MQIYNHEWAIFSPTLIQYQAHTHKHTHTLVYAHAHTCITFVLRSVVLVQINPD